MPFLKEQIQLVNDALRSVAFADERFQTGRYETIAYDAIRTIDETKKEIFPAIIGRDNMPEEISVNDTYPLILYHKIISSKYDLYGKNEFGKGDPILRQLTNVKMVIYGKYSALKMTRESLEALIITNFPDNFTPVQYKLTSMKVQPINTNFNSRQLWNEEYQGIDMRLSVEDIFFAVYYTLETIFQKGCFQICHCT